MDLSSLGQKPQDEPNPPTTQPSQTTQPPPQTNQPSQEPTTASDQQSPEAPKSDDSVVFTSHPIERFAIGRRWQFAKGILKLTPEEAKEFESDLAKQPHVVKNKVRKVDVHAAEKVAAEFLRSRMTTGVDTTGNSTPSPKPNA